MLLILSYDVFSLFMLEAHIFDCPLDFLFIVSCMVKNLWDIRITNSHDVKGWSVLVQTFIFLLGGGDVLPQ